MDIKRTSIISATIFLIFLFSTTISAQLFAPSGLDPTFGNGGKLLDGIARGYDDGISSAAIQADGIVAVGTSNGDFALARYNSDGSLDISFGPGGKVTTAIGSAYDAATSVAIQADGRILAAGQSQIGASGGYHLYELAVVRYNPDGTLDSSFGSGGIVRTRIGANAEARSIAIQADGKIVAGGSTHNSNYNFDDFALVRYNPNGSLDTAFGGDGIVTTSIAPISESASHDAAYSVAIQADGRIVAAGSTRIICTPNGCNNGFALIRYNSDGSLDSGFGNGGVVSTDIGPLEDIANSVAIQTDGRIVATGSTESVNGPRALVRYNANGSLDNTFGSGGKVVTQIGGAGCGASSVSIRPDGRIVTAGSAHNGQVWTFALTRHNSDGSLDATFSRDGILTTAIGSYSGASDVLFQPDGKIIAVGSGNEVSIQTFSDFALIRYDPDGSLDSTFDLDGKVTTNFADVFTGNTLYDVATQTDGKVVAAGVVYGFNYGVARYNPDGSIDTTFGNGTGKVAVGSPALRLLDTSVAIQPDGKTVVAGLEWYGDCHYNSGVAVMRFNSDGSPDTTFGDSGIVRVEEGHCSIYYDATWVHIGNDGKIIVGGGELIYRLNPNGSTDTTFGPGGEVGLPGLTWAYASAIQPNGKIVIAGPHWNGSSLDLVIARLDRDGMPDSTFGSGGLAITPTGLSWGDIGVVGRTVVIQTDGRIVAGGYRLVRYNENGSLDTGFGNGGIVTPPTGPFRDVVIQSNGKLVIAGNSNSDFAVGRFNPNGSLDTTFGGGDGITSVDFNNSNDVAYGMTLDTQGRALLVGESHGAFALARFRLAPPSAPFDFDGDGRSDISVFRPADRVWYLNRSTDGFSATQFGLSSDKITPSDYDGDGKTDISVFRNGTWFWLNSSTGVMQHAEWGIAGDKPQPADYTGDGRSDLAIYRGGTWFIYDIHTGRSRSEQFGLATDRPVASDYDADGRTDLAVYRDGLWYLQKSSEGSAAIPFGLATDRPVPADYDGDGETDIAVFRNGIWYVRGSAEGFSAFQFGVASDLPAPADFTGDGQADAAVFREGTWYIRSGTSGFTTHPFGLAGDQPLPSAFLR